VSQLGEPEGRLAASKLEGLHARLVGDGAVGAAKRLADMDASVRSLPFSITERLIAPDQIIDELDEVYQENAQKLGRLRNIFALAPLFATWIALALSTYFYNREISHHPDMVTQPFMLLWEQRFGGEPVPRFYEVALFDAFLIALVMLLTWRLHRAEKVGLKKQEATAELLSQAMLLLAVAVEKHNMAMPMTARDWAQQAQLVITAAAQGVVDLEATLMESEERSKRFVNELAVGTRDMLHAAMAANKRFVKETVEQTSVALRAALAADRKMINDEMAPLVASLRTSVDDFNRNAASHREDSAVFVKVITDLGATSKALAASASSYSAAVTSIETSLTKIEASQLAFAEKVGDFIDKVSGSAESMIKAAKGVEGVGGMLRTDLGAIAADLKKTGGSLARVSPGLSSAATSMETASADLRTASADLATQLAAAAAAGPAASRRPWYRRR
jgi:hypothetical protein